MIDRVCFPLVVVTLMAVSGFVEGDGRVRIQAETGRVEIEFYPSKHTVTIESFLKDVKAKLRVP